VPNAVSMLRVKKKFRYALWFWLWTQPPPCPVDLLISFHSTPDTELTRDKANSSRNHCIHIQWFQVPLLFLSALGKRSRILVSHVFSSIYFYSSAQVILYRQLDVYCFNILLSAGHREPDCLLVKLNLHWHASFVYFRLPAEQGRKKYLVHYSARLSVMKLWPCRRFICKHLSLSCVVARFHDLRQAFAGHWDFWDVLVLLKPKLSGFFLSGSFPLNLNLSLLPLISPFKPLDAHRIQQAPHRQITASTTKPLELESQICNLT